MPHLPHYLFQRGDEVVELAISMSKLEEHTERMAKLGWKRIYTPPAAIHIIPSSADSMNQAFKGEAGPPGWDRKKTMSTVRTIGRKKES
jgi:hypothetical protein